MLSFSSNPATPSRPLSSSPAPPPPTPLSTSPPSSSPPPLSETPTLSPPSLPPTPTGTPVEIIAASPSPSPMPLATLLDAGTRVDPATPDLPFHATSASGLADLTSLLDGSCPNLAWAGAVAPNGQTLIHAVAATENLDIIHLYVASGGGNLDWADSHGWTPLTMPPPVGTWMS